MSKKKKTQKEPKKAYLLLTEDQLAEFVLTNTKVRADAVIEAHMAAEDKPDEYVYLVEVSRITSFLSSSNVDENEEDVNDFFKY